MSMHIVFDVLNFIVTTIILNVMNHSHTDVKEDKNNWDRVGTSYEEDPYSFIEEDIYEELVPRCQVGKQYKRKHFYNLLQDTSSSKFHRIVMKFVGRTFLQFDFVD